LEKVNDKYKICLKFAQLFDLTKKYPEEKLPELFAVLIAENNPELAPYAAKLLPGKNQVLTDPHIQYIQALQSQIKLSSIVPTEIYERSNQADREYLQAVETKNKDTKEQTRLDNYRRLANFDLEKNISPEEHLDYVRAKIKEAMGVAV